MVDYIRFNSIQDIYSLTKTESQIISYFLDGYLSSKDISNILNISVSSVDNHFFNIRQKTNCFDKGMLFRLFMPYKKQYIIYQVASFISNQI